MALFGTSSGRTLAARRKDYFRMLSRDFSINKYVYVMAIPVVLFYILFHFVPMYGAIIAFKDFNPVKGILGSDWIGFAHFQSFFEGVYFWRVIRNTMLISLYSIVFGFPAPIILAILINEVNGTRFKRTVQTITYMPHFISLVVICGLIIDFTARDGLITKMLAPFGVAQTNLLLEPSAFRTIYISSDIWQEVGWNSIIYLSALTAINPEHYEAATIDGAGRWAKIWNVSLPGILPTIIVLLILRMGQVMSVGFEKIILLYNANTYETADVISSFVYRKGLLEFSYSYSSAVGLFNSVINLFFLLITNWLSKKYTDNSLW